jgi:cytochrome c oxidase cbb3-type subunit 3
MTSFWSGWVIVLTVITFVFMIWLLLGNRKRTRSTPDHGP